ncbi:MAG: Trk system potassium transporter TrkA [Clostridia bacterium]|nr:Trk system potassium transporter TrkA [Clostridia bacterium]
MNIIIAGCGKVGHKIVECLAIEEDHNITVIDSNPDVVSDITSAYDVMGVVGDASDVDTLKEADIKNSDILIAIMGSDELNMLTCLMAKKLGDCRTIARVRKPEHTRSIQVIKDELGLAMIVNPERAAASEIARILRFPSAIKIDTFAKGRIEILGFKVAEDSVLNDMKVSEVVSKLKSDILICGVERGNDAFIPDGNFVMKAGDNISIVSSIKNGHAFFRKIGIKTDRVKDTIIVGGGDTAYYLASQLVETGTAVKIIEKDSARCDELCQLLPKADIVHGDGTEKHLLMEEGLDSAESFVSLVNIDEENILLSLFAKTKTNGKIVTKVNRIEYDDVITNLDLGSVIYPKNITAEYIVRFVRAKKNSFGSNIETMHYILDGKAEALEFRIKEDSPVTARTLEELQLKPNILVACINRNNQIIIPRGKDTIMKGDTVIVVTTNSGYQDISDILK